MTFDAIIVAAGRSERAGAKKTQFRIGNDTMLSRTVSAFYCIRGVAEIVIVTREEDIDFVQSVISPYDKSRFKIVVGGESRSISVLHGLRAATAEGVLIHDGARPFVSEKIIYDVMASVESYGSGVPALPLSDSVRRVEDGKIVGGADRSSLYSVQTPQGFVREALLKAFELGKDEDYTDESLLYTQKIAPVHIVTGDERNLKITTMGDYTSLNSRVGVGYDIHRLAPFRKLVIGGIEIAHELGAVAHSDGDMAIHALIDALFAAIGESDIGTHFPDSDPKYSDIDSSLLLTETVRIVRAANYRIVNASIIIICERPKLADYIPVMRVKLGNLLGIPSSDVSVSAKTGEGTGEIGQGLAIAAYATATVC